jgi:hypothetical protein
VVEGFVINSGGNMRSCFTFLVLGLAILLAGCGGDKGTNDNNGNGHVKISRLVVDTTVTAPTLSDADESVWFQVDSTLVEIGGSEAYGYNNNIQKQNVVTRAIKKADTLYIWVRWHDPTGADIWADRLKKLSDAWDAGDLVGQDMFFILFDGQDNGTERADCATMCHTPIMKTTGGGHADAWKWMSTSTFPVFMSDDLWFTPTGTEDDNTVNAYIWRLNYDAGFRPRWMHVDTTDFHGPFLYWRERRDYTFQDDAMWPVGDTIPGYVVDDTLYSSVTRNNNSRNNVRAVAKFDSTGARTEWTWTLAFSRALNTGNSDDVNLAVLDSVQITMAATNNHHTNPLNQPEHSGSKPFWLILKP